MNDHRPESNRQTGVGPRRANKTAKTGASSVGDFGRFACPLFPGPLSNLSPVSKTCHSGFPDVRHIKEHLKAHHQCKNCLPPDGSFDSSEACQHPLHMTPARVEKMKGVPQRRRDETPCSHWVRLFRELRPGEPVPPPFLPTAHHIGAICRAPPPGFVNELQTRLQRMRVEDVESGGEDWQAKHLLRQMPIVLELVSMWGIHRGSGAADGASNVAAESSPVEAGNAGEPFHRVNSNEAWWVTPFLSTDNS